MLNKKNKPLVSVIMPMYNADKYVTEAIESVLFQTYDNIEFIIIDDGSTDYSYFIADYYKNNFDNIILHKHKKNLGIVFSRNLGFNLMSPKTKYVAIFDADDIMLKDKIAAQVEYMENNPDIAACGGHTYIINEKTSVLGERLYETSPEKLKQNILINSPFAQPTVMIRESILSSIGNYSADAKFDRARDYDLWVRIADKHKISNMDKHLIQYRVSTTQGKTIHLKQTIRSTIQIRKKWLLKKGYFNVKALIRHIMEHALLCLPNKFILWLFKKVSYKPCTGDKI